MTLRDRRSVNFVTVIRQILILMAVHTGIFIVMYPDLRYQFTMAVFVYTFIGFGIATLLPLPALGTPAAACSSPAIPENISAES